MIAFASDIIGSDGARGRLRDEQNGYCLEFRPRRWLPDAELLGHA
jgi:hypothetical protein